MNLLNDFISSTHSEQEENTNLIYLEGGISVRLTPASADSSKTGIIDSGIGGAVVRKELLDRTNLNSHELISCLVGQTIGGIAPDKTKMIFRDMVLATLEHYPSVRTFVVACNTFAGIGAEAIIRKVAADKNIAENIFIITPIEQAVERIKGITSIHTDMPVVIMATDAICRMRGPQFPASYQAELWRRGIDRSNSSVLFQPEQALIDLIQKGDDDALEIELKRIVEYDLLPMVLASNRLAIVLGCTHFHRGIEETLRVFLGHHGVEANFINTNELVVAKTVESIASTSIDAGNKDSITCK